MEKAEKHTNPVILTMDQIEQLFISVMLEHEKEIIELRDRLRRKDKKEGKRTESGLVHGTLPPRLLHLRLRKD